MTYGTPDTVKKLTNLPKTDASRYEPGTKAVLEIIAMQASLELLMNCGIENIYNEASRLAGVLSAGLKDKKYKVISNGPIVNFVPKEAAKLELIMKKLDEAKVSYARRGPGIRLSSHAYNRDAEIERVLNLLS